MRCAACLLCIPAPVMLRVGILVERLDHASPRRHLATISLEVRPPKLTACNDGTSTALLTSTKVRPFHGPRSFSAAGRRAQRTATNTRSAFAASFTLTDLMCGSSSSVKALSDCAPGRLRWLLRFWPERLAHDCGHALTAATAPRSLPQVDSRTHFAETLPNASTAPSFSTTSSMNADTASGRCRRLGYKTFRTWPVRRYCCSTGTSKPA